MSIDRHISRSQLSLEVGFFSIYFVVGGILPTLENAQQFISEGTLRTTVWYHFTTGTLNIFLVLLPPDYTTFFVQVYSTGSHGSS